MASMMLKSRISTASAATKPAPTRPVHVAAAAAAAPRTWQQRSPPMHPGRSSTRRFSSDTGADNDDKLVGERGEVLQGKQEKPTMTGAGMGSEEKRAEEPAQGAAPEGDRAVAGQETQLTGEPGPEPDTGDKMPDESSNKDAGQVASQEAQQQEDRAPLQD